ncbi:Tolloid-like protein 2 (Metalloprotease xolloid) (Xenopus tolloid) [Durusdinium trenchii]|uniref:Metalloendopeptidase n=1 Tax=Durusdinium trenchii TaxID=1381693 RepID=A0ABP0MZF5_9DINO
MSPATCFEFCVGAGLDLFALVQGEECRCGASRLNKGVWGEKSAPPGHLQLPAPLSSCLTDQACPVRVYRWLGPFVSGGSVPEHLLMLKHDRSIMNVGNTIYVDSIVHGKRITEEQEEDGKVPPPPKEAKLHDVEHLKEQAVDPRWDRPCGDNPGCQAGRQWKNRNPVAPPGMVAQWEEYVIVPYKFDAGVDDARKEVFRAAAAEWRLHTCVALVEDDDAALFYILVGIYDLNSCWAHLGSPEPYYYYHQINLGWCKEMAHKGSLIHEIYHSLASLHEQQRADGSQVYYGKGPHLEMFWQNTGKWASQYDPNVDSYIGSADDGGDDPQIGYAAYDFESIMHYYRQRNYSNLDINDGYYYNTIPASANTLVGNRVGFSQGDIVQALDAYRCRCGVYQCGA